jgi:predicted negative regulator of RcsB-dependent stress response
MITAGVRDKVYYSYKSKKRNVKKYKFLLAILIIALGIYVGNKYKQYIFFWEYTYNKLCESLSSIEKIPDNDRKIKRLRELNIICNQYNDENRTSSDAFSLSAKVHFQMGELYRGGSFSDMLIMDNMYDMNKNARTEFTNSIIDFKKMIALSPGREIDIQDSLFMAMACYYTDYYSGNQIYKIIKKIDNPDSFINSECARFCAVVNIINGNFDKGLDILKKYDNKSDSVKGRLFLATAFKIAGRYTNSLIEFKSILDKTNDIDIKKLININLGKIYYNQSLYNESLYHFTNALNIDARDNQLKIWIGRNYSALGLKIKAKAIWSEVLASDNSNEEAKKLLGLM